MRLKRAEVPLLDSLADHVETQIQSAISEAQLVLFIVDAREGITSLDNMVAKRLRKLDTPVVLVANKIDQLNQMSEVHELAKLGFGDPIRISAIHTLGLGEVRDAISEHIGDSLGETPPNPIMQLAIVGKRNAGKSTFINTLTGEERVIVSSTPGTTRDDVGFRVLTGPK